MYRSIVSALVVLSAGVLAATAVPIASAKSAAESRTAGSQGRAKAPAKAETKPAAPQQRGREEDEKAVRATAEAFAKAYDAHDAKAIAALFTPNAELVDVDGDAKQGRGEIERIFASIFEEYPEAKMAVEIKSLRFLSGALAVEDGVATVTHEPNTPADPSRYTVLHVKHEGKWLMASTATIYRTRPKSPRNSSSSSPGWSANGWTRVPSRW